MCRCQTITITVLEVQGPVFNRPPYVAWYEHYGCALLFWVRHVGVVQLELVGLDCWSFSMHSGPEGRTQSSQTACHRSVSLQVGTLPLEDYPKFLERMKILLELAEKRKANERSAAFNRQGHQKTPSFIQAIVRDALETLDTEGEEPPKNPTKPRLWLNRRWSTHRRTCPRHVLAYGPGCAAGDH